MSRVWDSHGCVGAAECGGGAEWECSSTERCRNSPGVGGGRAQGRGAGGGTGEVQKRGAGCQRKPGHLDLGMAGHQTGGQRRSLLFLEATLPSVRVELSQQATLTWPAASGLSNKLQAISFTPGRDGPSWGMEQQLLVGLVCVCVCVCVCVLVVVVVKGGGQPARGTRRSTWPGRQVWAEAGHGSAVPLWATSPGMVLPCCRGWALEGCN